MACPVFTVNGLVQYIEQYKFIFGPAFMAAGLFLALLGYKVFQAALFMVITLFVAFLVLFLCYATFLYDETAAWVGWLMLGVSLLFGLLGGYLMIQFEKVGGAVLAGWGGFMIGILINESFLFLAGALWLFWVVNIACAGIAAILGFVLFDHAVTFGTSFMGSYFFMKGISVMAGGMPSIYVVMKALKNDDITSFDAAFYGYFAGIIVMTVLASIFQYKFWLRPALDAKETAYDRLNG